MNSFFNSKFSKIISISLAMLGTIAMIGCGSGGADEESIQKSNAANLLATIQANQAVANSLQTETTQNIECDPSGSVNVTGNIDPQPAQTNFDLILNYLECAGLSGTLNLSGSGNTDGDNFDFVYTIEGDLGGDGCDLSYDGFTITFENGTATFNGSLVADCGSGSFSCHYDNVSFTDQQALEDACL
jgi:hypothetical protein